MRTLLAIGLLTGVIGVATADDKGATAGKWTIESLTRDGKADDSLKGAIRVHDGDKYTVTPAAGSATPAVSGTFTVDGAKSPATIDMKPGAGRYKDKVLLGIYKVDGDSLTIAFAEPDKPRPTTFESKPGSGVVVAIHKRVK